MFKVSLNGGLEFNLIKELRSFCICRTASLDCTSQNDCICIMIYLVSKNSRWIVAIKGEGSKLLDLGVALAGELQMVLSIICITN